MWPKNWLFEVLPLGNLLLVESTAHSSSLTAKKGAYNVRWFVQGKKFWGILLGFHFLEIVCHASYNFHAAMQCKPTILLQLQSVLTLSTVWHCLARTGYVFCGTLLLEQVFQNSECHKNHSESFKHSRKIYGHVPRPHLIIRFEPAYQTLPTAMHACSTPISEKKKKKKKKKKRGGEGGGGGWEESGCASLYSLLRFSVLALMHLLSLE